MTAEPPVAGAAGAGAWGALAEQRDVWPTPLQELLLCAALLDDERAVSAWRRVRAHLDIPRLDGASIALLPLLRKNLIALGLDDELLPVFKGVHRFTWARNQMLLNRMLPVVAELERVGISTLLLKGAALLADARMNAGMRSMNDVDVLVPTGMRSRAIDVLISAGLEPVGDVPTWYIAEYAPRFVPSHGFRDEDDRQLDLHWHVLHASCQPGADEDFWAAAVTAELAGVRTRCLCPADELLLVILHGLRWNAIPTYRWVVDAALLARGVSGAVDFDRILEQARRRRVATSVAAGLAYLRKVADVTVPETTLRALRSAGSSRLERFEFRAQMTEPRRRGALQRELVYHEQYLRRELPLGVRPTIRHRIALERRRLGVERPRDLRWAIGGGVPGPGRPSSEMAAAIGTGVPERSATPIALGEPIALDRAEVVRSYCLYGLWRPEGAGAWIAGREGQLSLPLERAASTSLVLEVSADGFLGAGRSRQRLDLSVNGAAAASLTIDSGGLREELIVLPQAAVAGRRSLDLVFGTPDATSPAVLGIDDDDRRVGVLLRRLLVREPRVCEVGVELAFGEGSGDEEMLLGGWSHPEPSGRWTEGELAQILLRLDGASGPLDLEFEAAPFLGSSGRSLQVEVLANQHSLRSVTYDATTVYPLAVRIPVPATAIGVEGELLLSWRIRDPLSPSAEGISEDERLLGLLLRRVAVLPRAEQRTGQGDAIA
jgi:hypothetical protein